MDTFRVIAKLWPNGTEIDLGDDTNNVTVPSIFDRHAANFVTPDGKNNFQFLFWNTGRHVTNKRHVRWNFSVGSWGSWTATKWYGTPTTGPGRGVIHVEGFTIGGDAPLGPDTAIDGSASTFPPGAWPLSGNDHEIGTTGGPVDVVAKDPFHALQFAGWLSLVFGGDDSGLFIETDAGDPMGSSSFFEHSSGPFHVAQNGGANLLATYGNSTAVKPGRVDWGKFVAGGGFQLPGGPIGPGDPGPDDLIRLIVLQQLLRQTRPVEGGGIDAQQVITNVANMSPEELKRARTSLQTAQDLNKSAISAVEAQLKAKGNG